MSCASRLKGFSVTQSYPDTHLFGILGVSFFVSPTVNGIRVVQHRTVLATRLSYTTRIFRMSVSDHASTHS